MSKDFKGFVIKACLTIVRKKSFYDQICHKPRITKKRVGHWLKVV